MSATHNHGAIDATDHALSEVKAINVFQSVSVFLSKTSFPFFTKKPVL